jgi:hypothetical protein
MGDIMKINLRTQIGIFVAISFSLAVCPARAQDWGTPPVKDEIETRVISRTRSAPRDFYKFFERVGHNFKMGLRASKAKKRIFGMFISRLIGWVRSM